MTTENPDLTATAFHVASLVDGVRDEHLTAPTPCADYTVAALLDHLMGLSLAFTDAANKKTGPLTASAPDPKAANLESNWRVVLPHRLAELARAWTHPDAWEGEAQAGGVTFPAAVMGRVALDEIVIHGWDLARATGQDYRPGPEALATVTEFMAADADDQQAREGMFGPVIRTFGGASALDTAIGLSGRDPDWRPSA